MDCVLAVDGGGSKTVALVSLKQQVDFATIGNDGDGIRELVLRLLAGMNKTS